MSPDAPATVDMLLHLDTGDAVSVRGALMKINGKGDEAASIRFVAVTEDGRGGEHGRAEVEVRDDDAGRLRQLLRKALADVGGAVERPPDLELRRVEETISRLVLTARDALKGGAPLDPAKVYAVASECSAAVAAVRRPPKEPREARIPRPD